MSRFRAISFDCYGTLVDWETGILEAMGALLERRDASRDVATILESFARHEAHLESQRPMIPYSGVLARAAKGMGRDWSVVVSDEDAVEFAVSLRRWPLFADVLPALRLLAQQHVLAILSNVDRTSFSHTERQFEGLIDVACIAEETGAYKPAPEAFEALLAALSARGIAKTEVLHVAQSMFHDHEPARCMGLATCWIDRRHGQAGWGAVPAPSQEIQCDYSIVSLMELPKLL